MFPAYIVVVEFSKPLSHVVKNGEEDQLTFIEKAVG